jgi:hypothetical protein
MVDDKEPGGHYVKKRNGSQGNRIFLSNFHVLILGAGLNTMHIQDESLVLSGRILLFISPSMPLTGLSLEMYSFHFEAISLSTHISGSK